MATGNDLKIDDRIRFLKRSEIFEALGVQHLTIVLDRGSLESYSTPGSLLFQQKDTIARMVQQIPYTEASIYMVLSEMRQKGMIA
jgi:hypothetical protein